MEKHIDNSRRAPSRVIAILHRTRKRMSTAALHKALLKENYHVAPSSMPVLMWNLSKEGFVRKLPSEECDCCFGRVVLYELTSAGRARYFQENPVMAGETLC